MRLICLSKMEVFTNLFTISSIFIIAIYSPVLAQDVCLTKGPCKCEFSDGTGIDLSSSMKSSFYTTSGGFEKTNTSIKLTTYMYHPCVDAVPVVDDPSLNSTCNVSLALCRKHYEMKKKSPDTYSIDAGAYDWLGNSMQSNFTTNGNDTAIVYYNGPSSTLVVLKCTTGSEELHIVSLVEKNLVLAFFSPSACYRQLESPGRSFGSTLCIIFFCIAIFYLVLGICTKKFLMGATGLEVIPNLGFWSDLPNLVKDGWAFSANGFKLPARAAAAPDPHTYDSI